MPTPTILPKNLLLKKAREGPCPEKALLSLTPGIGYIPVVEFDPRAGSLVIQDPCNPNLEHLFQNKSQAADWLNQYFLERFIFRPKFNMQWVMMTGSIIRMLQPLNKDIFKYKARSLTIRRCGVELERSHPVDQDFVNWERRELSVLKRKIEKNNDNNNKKNEVCFNVKEDDPDFKIKKSKSANHNDLERLRRSELAELIANLGKEVFPEHLRLSKVGILTRATYMCEAQKMIEEELRMKSTNLKKKMETLNKKLKGIFSEFPSHEEKKKALDLCKFIRCNQYKLPDMSDKYIHLMRNKENKLISKLHQDKRFSRPESTSSLRSSSSSGSLGSLQGVDTTSQEATTLDTAGTQQPLRTGGAKQPTEGVLVKSKLRSLTASRPDLKIYSASKKNEVIDLVDSDEEDKNVVIELESEEEEVIWLPAKEQLQQKDDDIEIISSNFKARRPRLKFPKPKRNLPQCSSKPPDHNFGKTVNDSSLHTQEQGLCRTTGESSTSSSTTLTPAPVAMVLSPAVLEQHRLAAERARTQSGPEFVSVAEHDYEPLFSEFPSCCSRTDPVPDKYRANLKLAQQQFIPIEQLVVRPTPATIGTPNNTTTPILQKPTPSAGFQQIKLRNMTPIGKISPNGNMIRFKGKTVLVRKSNEGFQISKFPMISTPPPLQTPLNATPVMITESSGSRSTPGTAPEKVSPDRANTVTLYHPEAEISVTKTVKFSDLNSVVLDMPVSSVLSGPKIRKPKGEGALGSLRVLLPKRN